MTLVDDPPAMTVPPPACEPVTRSAVPAWRFASRLARREVRRRPGRTILAALLIAVPVAAMTNGSIVARTNAADWSLDYQRDYGDTDIVLGASTSTVASDDDGSTALTPLPDGSTTREYLWTGTPVTASNREGDTTVAYVQFGNMTFSDKAATAGIDITSGRAPEPGEVLLGTDLAGRLGIGAGDQLTLTRPSGTWLVAGLGEIRGNYSQDPLIIPGFDTARISPDYGAPMTWIDLPDGTPVDTIRRIAAERGGLTRYDNPNSRPDDLDTGMAWGFVAGVLALVAVGIIVAAAFATSARRQLVTIGQLRSNGASEAVVRRTLALQGSWTGVVGAIVGVTGGLALLPLTRSLIARHIVQHEIRAFRFSVTDIVVITITAVVAATIAAAVPARSAARVPVMTALAGRRPTGTPAPWLVPTGLALLFGGLGLVAVAALGAKGDTQGSNIWALLVVIGGTAMVFGTCCAAPLVIEKIGGLGHRSSLSWRMALRSLARSRSRSAAVVAAIAVTVGGATAVAAIAELVLREDSNCCQAALPADAIVVSASQSFTVASDSIDLTDYGPLVGVEVRPSTMAAIAAIAPDGDVFPYAVATFDPAPFDPSVDYNDPSGPMIATPALLDLLGVSPADRTALAATGAMQPRIADGYAVTSDGDGFANEAEDPVSGSPTAEYRSEGGVITVPYAFGADPLDHPWTGQLLITEQAAADAGFTIVETGVIIRAGADLTTTQLDQLSALQNELWGTSVDAFIEPGDTSRLDGSDQPGAVQDEYFDMWYEDPRWQSSSADDLWIARLVILGAALALSLLVVSIGLALAAAEGREERDTFTIVGARPSSMRRQAAARAAVLALVGIGLGIPLGFAPTWVVDRVANSGIDSYATDNIQVPWLVVGVLLVVIPSVAAAGAWTVSGLANHFRPATPARRD
ncbi:MAG: FtsX-like permease family protein [Acidimicrobiales bacterium]